ncbi:MAG: NAD(P)H-dependent oxidoreductase [Aristaeellaceae bacterium]
MKLLMVNACPRLSASRTLRLTHAFLEELCACRADVAVTEHCLPTMGLKPIDEKGLALREPLCDARDWTHPFLRPAVAFQQADAVVIAAPYWDLSFPSMLKVWVENVYVRNLTFRYEHDRCIGLCRGREAVYITTAGSPIGANDWGAGYMQAVLRSLGIPGFTQVRAEGIDLDGCDVEAVLHRAEEEVRQAARNLASRIP